MKTTIKQQIEAEATRQLSNHGEFKLSSTKADEDSFRIYGTLDGKSISARITGILPHPLAIESAVNAAIRTALSA